MPRIHPQQTCPPNAATYFVQPGDTLNSIARRFGSSVPAIEAANPGINIYALMPGQEICIPAQPYYVPCPGGQYYVVRRGDEIQDIARRYSVDVDRLVTANPHIYPGTLAIGQVICIPH